MWSTTFFAKALYSALSSAGQGPCSGLVLDARVAALEAAALDDDAAIIIISYSYIFYQPVLPCFLGLRCKGISWISYTVIGVPRPVRS